MYRLSVSHFIDVCLNHIGPPTHNNRLINKLILHSFRHILFFLNFHRPPLYIFLHFLTGYEMCAALSSTNFVPNQRLAKCVP
jgi:hypothetical protein